MFTLCRLSRELGFCLGVGGGVGCFGCLQFLTVFDVLGFVIRSGVLGVSRVFMVLVLLDFCFWGWGGGVVFGMLVVSGLLGF